MQSKKALRHFAAKAGIAAIAAGTTSLAMAQDAAALVTEIGAGKADVNLIGWAFMGVLVAAVLFKYMRRAA